MKKKLRFVLMVLCFLAAIFILIRFDWHLLCALFILLVGFWILGGIMLEREKSKKYNGKL